MYVLGCRLDDVDAAAATERIVAFARDGAAAQVVTLGTEMVVYAQRDARFREVVNACALSLCDTVGLLAVARRRGAAIKERVTGVEAIEHVCARAARERLPIYLLGAAPGVALEAASALQARHPGLVIAGTRDGYFAASENDAVVNGIRESGARVLFVGLGFPRQEFWLSDNLRATGAGVGVGVGGSFDVIAGRVERAPERWRKMHAEWLYRLLREPHRWRRQLALPYFVWLVLLDGFRSKRSST